MTTFASMEKATQYELRLAERMSRLGTETAFEVLNKARALERQGKDIVHLEIGEPDFDTPKDIVEAGVEALKAGWTHYGPSAGLPELRARVAAEVGDRQGANVHERGERQADQRMNKLATPQRDWPVNTASLPCAGPVRLNFRSLAVRSRLRAGPVARRRSDATNHESHRTPHGGARLP